MKRISIALAAIGLSATIFAALPATTEPTVVGIPLLRGGFFVGLTSAWLESSASSGDLDYATTSFGTVTNFTGSVNQTKPGYDWGWGFNLGYIFPNTANDVNASYLHFDKTNRSFAIAPTPSDVNFVPIDILSDLNFPITNENVRAKYALNQIDITAGQYIDVGCRLILHPNIGLRWASLERKLNSAFLAPVPNALTSFTTEPETLTEKEDSNFSGAGALLGLDGSYYLGMGFGVVGHFDSAFLVGNIDNRLSATEVFLPFPLALPPPSQPLLYVSSTSFFNSDNDDRIVPVVDAKLGADYTYIFHNATNSDLTLEGGWQFSKYYDAVDRLSVNAQTLNNNTIFKRTTSDFGLNGPYVSLTFHA